MNDASASKLTRTITVAILGLSFQVARLVLLFDGLSLVTIIFSLVKAGTRRRSSSLTPETHSDPRTVGPLFHEKRVTDQELHRIVPFTDQVTFRLCGQPKTIEEPEAPTDVVDALSL